MSVLEGNPSHQFLRARSQVHAQAGLCCGESRKEVVGVLIPWIFDDYGNRCYKPVRPQTLYLSTMNPNAKFVNREEEFG